MTARGMCAGAAVALAIVIGGADRTAAELVERPTRETTLRTTSDRTASTRASDTDRRTTSRTTTSRTTTRGRSRTLPRTTPTGTTPIAPSNLSAFSECSAGSLRNRLTWTKGSAATFDVFRDNSKLTSGRACNADTSGRCRYTDAAGLKAGASYRYRVHAAGTSLSSNDRQVTAPSTCAPTPPPPTAGGLRLLGSTATPRFWSEDLRVDATSGLAVAANRLGGLRILDVSQPASPREVGAIDLPGLESDVWLLPGGYAYVPQVDHLAIVDLRAPSSPRVVGAVPFPGRPLALTGEGSTIYVGGANAAFTAGVLVALDASNIAAPRVLGSLAVPHSIHVAEVHNGVVATVGLASGVVDARNPAAMTWHSLSTGTFFGIGFSDREVLLAGGQSMMFDVTNPAVRVLSSSVRLPASDIAVYAGDAVSIHTQGFQVWRTALSRLRGRGFDRTLVTPDAKLEIPARPTSMALVGDLLYVTDQAGGFHVIELLP
ncbi:hypothetical protein KJ059_06805 [Myxococcota bacterium]|nr:hypothetical protein [Myxococcota bacterium]MCZ7620258.1 hypothetical protein [Myxococcota bacterium]